MAWVGHMPLRAGAIGLLPLRGGIAYRLTPNGSSPCGLLRPPLLCILTAALVIFFSIHSGGLFVLFRRETLHFSQRLLTCQEQKITKDFSWEKHFYLQNTKRHVAEPVRDRRLRPDRMYNRQVQHPWIVVGRVQRTWCTAGRVLRFRTTTKRIRRSGSVAGMCSGLGAR